MNETPTAKVHGVTLKEKFIGRKQDLAHLNVFGCIAYVHIPCEKKSKLDSKSWLWLLHRHQIIAIL